VLDSAPKEKGEEYPGGVKHALYPKVSIKQVRQELSFDEYKQKELTEGSLKEGVFEYKDRVVRMWTWMCVWGYVRGRGMGVGVSE
jgi:hypothetical protein